MLKERTIHKGQQVKARVIGDSGKEIMFVAFVIRSTKKWYWHLLIENGPHRHKCIVLKSSEFQELHDEKLEGLLHHLEILPKEKLDEDFFACNSTLSTKSVEMAEFLLTRGFITMITKEEMLETCKTPPMENEPIIIAFQ